MATKPIVSPLPFGVPTLAPTPALAAADPVTAGTPVLPDPSVVATVATNKDRDTAVPAIVRLQGAPAPVDKDSDVRPISPAVIQAVQEKELLLYVNAASNNEERQVDLEDALAEISEEEWFCFAYQLATMLPTFSRIASLPDSEGPEGESDGLSEMLPGRNTHSFAAILLGSFVQSFIESSKIKPPRDEVITDAVQRLVALVEKQSENAAEIVSELVQSMWVAERIVAASYASQQLLARWQGRPMAEVKAEARFFEPAVLRHLFGDALPGFPS